MQQAAWHTQHTILKQAELNIGLDIIEISNPFCRATIALQGAQVLSYQRHDAAPVLWLSEQTKLQAGQAVRGGIPLCFPWFGKNTSLETLPSHGFARNLPWTLDSITETESGHQLVFSLSSDDSTFAKWPYHFLAKLTVEVGQQLTLTFAVKNTDSKSFEFKFAYHSYFAIQDISHVQVTGLEGTEFLDQLKPELGDQLTEAQPIWFVAETDRVYHQASGEYRIVEAAQPDIFIDTDCPDAVVWNPWVEKTLRLGDMSADSWQQMVCVECGVMDKPFTLSAGEMKAFKMVLGN